MGVKGIAVLWLLVPALAAAQSLGEVAQKEKERRKKIQQTGAPSTVITDSELKSNHGSLANDPKAAPSAAPQGSPRPASPVPSPSDPRRDEESWRGRFTEATARLDDAKKRHDTLNSLSLVGGEYYADENGNPTITSVGQLRRLIAQAKAQMDAAQKALDDLLESARQQNVPPGWLR